MTPHAKKLAEKLHTFIAMLVEGRERALQRHLPRNVSSNDVRVLFAVEAAKGESVSAVARQLGVSQSAMSEFLPKLEKRRLLTSKASADERKRSFQLTSRGKAVLQDAEMAYGEVASALCDAAGTQLTAFYFQTVVDEFVGEGKAGGKSGSGTPSSKA